MTATAVADERGAGAIACHDCGLVHRVVALWPRTAARCTRCDALLYARHRLGLDAVIALYLTAAILFLIAVSARFITLNIEGLGGTSALWSGVTALWREGMPQLALVAYVKLRDLAQVELGPGLWALGAAIVTLAAAEAALDRREVWDRLQPQATLAALRARPGRVTLDCHTCGQLTTLADGTADPHCPRCHGLLHRRKPDSLERAWGLVAAATILYLPANL
jgi:paraquat-inducible protein A